MLNWSDVDDEMYVVSTSDQYQMDYYQQDGYYSNYNYNYDGDESTYQWSEYKEDGNAMSAEIWTQSPRN